MLTSFTLRRLHFSLWLAVRLAAATHEKLPDSPRNNQAGVSPRVRVLLTGRLRANVDPDPRTNENIIYKVRPDISEETKVGCYNRL